MSTITLPFRPLKLVRPPEPPKLAPQLPASSDDVSREDGDDRVILRDRLLKMIVEREAQRRAPPKPA